MTETEPGEVECANEALDRSHRIVRRDIILDPRWKETGLLTALAGLECAIRHKPNRTSILENAEFLPSLYRQRTGQFDRVVSVGMMEHVGIGHFDEYFLKIRELLKPDGYAFIHCIGRMSQPGTTGPFIRKYIFPGGYVPALSEGFAATERCGLLGDDMEGVRLHFRYTGKHLRQRFATNRAHAAAVYVE